MHPVDEAILANRVTPALLREHARLPLPEAGTSYWGDAMHELQERGATADDLALCAAKRAERQMGDAVARLTGTDC